LEPYGFLLGEPVHEVAAEKAEIQREQTVSEFKKKPYRRYRNKPRKKPEGSSSTPPGNIPNV